MSDWTFWPKPEPLDRECYELNEFEHGVIRIYKEGTAELANLELLKQDWQNSFLHVAQRDVIKVTEGYFIVNPDGKYHRPPIFEPIDPHPYCPLNHRLMK